jgi:alkylhydroperoxidase/carboxymuconolactone decarboxylase family protein YurZ
MELAPVQDAFRVPAARSGMGEIARFQEILRRLAIIDEGFAEDQAGLGLRLPVSRRLDPKTAALVRVGALVAIGLPGVCLEWSTTRALAAGATEDEITGVLLAIAPVAGLGRVTAPSPASRPRSGMTSRPRCWNPDNH